MAPFVYQDEQNPFAMSIAQVMGHRGDIAASGARDVAAMQARAAEISGQARAQAVQGLAAIPQQMEQARAAAQDREMRQRTLDHARAADRIGGLITASMTTTPDGHLVYDTDAFLKNVQAHPELAAVAHEPLDAMSKANTAYQDYTQNKTATKVQTLSNVLARAAEAGGTADDLQVIAAPFVTAGVLSAGDILPWVQRVGGVPDQNARVKILNGAAGVKSEYHTVGEGGSLVATEPGAAPTVVATGQPKPPTEADLAARAAGGDATAQTALEKLQAPTMAGRDETARHNAELERIANLTAGREAAGAAETARHNRAMETANDAAPNLTPEARRMAAQQFAMTGQLPPMGMGKAGAKVRTDIINEAADMYKGLDLASQTAAYAANKDSLKKLQTQRDAIGAFENTAKKNIQVFLDTAAKVVDTGSPLANTLVRQASGKLLGSADQAAYDAARQVAVNEIAKITSNPTLSGTLSDSARHEVEAFNPANATLGQSVKVMRLLLKDMDNRTGSLDEQLSAVKQRIATPPGGSALKGSGTVTMRAPSGQTREVSAAEVEHYKALGATVVP